MNSLSIKNNLIAFGHFDILLLDTSTAMFRIFENLAEYFGENYQADAVKMLQAECNKLNLKPKPSIDYESDYTEISSRSVDTIFAVAKLINQLSTPQHHTNLNKKEINDIYKKLKAWKRPPKQKWQIGDVISVPMANNSFAFGQIVGIHTKTCPILALFDVTQKSIDISLEKLKQSKPIVVFNSSAEEIQNYTYKVLMNTEILVTPDRVKHKKSIGGANLGTLANLYFGLAPWNVMYKDDYYDDYFLEEVGRPKNILWLSDEERLEYRRKHFNVDENNEYIK